MGVLEKKIFYFSRLMEVVDTSENNFRMRFKETSSLTVGIRIKRVSLMNC